MIEVGNEVVQVAGLVDRIRVRRTSVVAVIVVVALAAASGCSGGTDQSPESSPPNATSPARVDDAALPTVDDSVPQEPATGATTPNGMVAGDPGALEAAGVHVVEQAADLTSIEAPLVLVRVQADRLLADVGPGSGLLGAAIDELVPLPADVPPMSFLIAAWVSTADSTAAVTSREWMGDQDWTDAPQINFPDAVVALFVHDIASSVQAAAAANDGSLQIDTSALLPPGPQDVEPVADIAGFASPKPAAVMALAGPCNAVQSFLSSALAAVINALHINPVSGGGIVGDVTNVFVSVFNAAVALAAGTVKGLIEGLVAPVFDIIRIGIATLAVATQFASFFRDTKLTVTTAPPGPYRFAIGAEPDITGQFVARADALSGEWPAELATCAADVGVSLPTPVGAGADATWTVEQKATVMAPKSTTSKVGADLTARLDFTTGHESDEAAKGAETNSAAFATVRIPRKDVEDLLQLGRDQATAAKAILLGRIPIPALRTLADAALSAIIDPVLSRVQAEIAGAAAGMFTLSGNQLVFVRFHQPPDTTTSSAPTTDPTTSAPEDDFCTQFRALVDFTENSDADVVPWATEIVQRLERMRPAAPTDLVDDVDVMLRVYSAVAAQDNVLVLIQTTEPLPAAAAAVGSFCGIGSSG